MRLFRRSRDVPACPTACGKWARPDRASGIAWRAVGRWTARSAMVASVVAAPGVVAADDEPRDGGASSAEGAPEQPVHDETVPSASEGESAPKEPLEAAPPVPDPVPPTSSVSRQPAAFSPDSSPEAAKRDDLATTQIGTGTEPIFEAIIGAQSSPRSDTSSRERWRLRATSSPWDVRRASTAHASAILACPKRSFRSQVLSWRSGGAPISVRFNRWRWGYPGACRSSAW